MTVRKNTIDREEERRRRAEDGTIAVIKSVTIVTNSNAIDSKEKDTMTNNDSSRPLNITNSNTNIVTDDEDATSVYTTDNSVAGDPKKRKKKKKSFIRRLSSRMSLTKKKKRRKEEQLPPDIQSVDDEKKESAQHSSLIRDNNDSTLAENDASVAVSSSTALFVNNEQTTATHNDTIPSTSNVETETLTMDTILHKQNANETILEEETNASEQPAELTLPQILSNDSSYDEDECDVNSVVTDVSWDAQFSPSGSSSPRVSFRHTLVDVQAPQLPAVHFSENGDIIAPPTPPILHQSPTNTTTQHSKILPSALSTSTPTTTTTTTTSILSTDKPPKKPKPRGRKSVKFADEEGNPLISSTRSISPDPPSLSSHHDSLSSSLDGKLTRIIVLLMCPTTKQFELVNIYYDDTERTELSYILQQIRSKATFPLLLKQRYVGLCKPDLGTEMINLLSVQDYDIEPNDVVIAIPKGMNGQVCAKLAKPILDDKRLIRLIQRGKKRKKRRSSSSSSSTSSSSSASIPEQICVGEEKTTDHLPSGSTQPNEPAVSSTDRSIATLASPKLVSEEDIIIIDLPSTSKGKQHRHVLFIFMTVVTIIIVILFIHTAGSTPSTTTTTTTTSIESISPQNHDISTSTQSLSVITEETRELQQQQPTTTGWDITTIIQSNIDVWITNLSHHLHFWTDGIVTRNIRELFRYLWNRQPFVSLPLILPEDGEGEDGVVGEREEDDFVLEMEEEIDLDEIN